MQHSHKLKNSNKSVFMVPTLRQDGFQKWGSDHRRVFVAYNEQELAASKNGAKGHIQVVKKSNLLDANKQ